MVLVDLFLPLILSFFFFFFWFWLVYFEASLLGTYTVRTVTFSSLIIVKYSSLYLKILFILKYTLILTCLVFAFFFHPSFNLSVPLYLICISFEQDKVGSDNLRLLIGVFTPFIVDVIIGVIGFKSVILLFVFCFYSLFFVSLFVIFCFLLG